MNVLFLLQHARVTKKHYITLSLHLHKLQDTALTRYLAVFYTCNIIVQYSNGTKQHVAAPAAPSGSNLRQCLKSKHVRERRCLQY